MRCVEEVHVPGSVNVIHLTIIVLNITDLQILYQSPSEISVSSITHAIPLYCVSSHHCTSIYHWMKLGESTTSFPSTPVIYVDEVGLFQCKVESGDVAEQSTVIALEVQPG